MKKFLTIGILLLSICFCSVACNNTNKQEDDSIATVVKEETHLIIFDFNNIDTIVSIDDDDAIVLHYCDYDAFDYDNLAYLTGREHWYGEYVSVSIDDTIITEFLNDYYKYITSIEYEERMELCDKYIIVEEDIKYKNGERDIIFFIRSNIKSN